MRLPNLEEIDQIRKNGHRPQVVGCFLNNKKILFVFSEKYNLWQFPQGGIDNGEDIKIAVLREMREELGVEFTDDIKIEGLIGGNKIEFSPDKWGSRELTTDDGQEILMKGKEYFFIAINSEQTELDINQTEFNNYQWLDYDEALELTKTIYQKGKRRITEDVLGRLRELGLL